MLGETEDTITVAQMLIDYDEQNDWEAVFSVSLAQSRAENRPVITFVTVRPLGTA